MTVSLKGWLRRWARLEVDRVQQRSQACLADGHHLKYSMSTWISISVCRTARARWPGSRLEGHCDLALTLEEFGTVTAGVKPQPRPCRRHWTMVDGCAAAALHPTSLVSRPGNTQGPRAMAADKHGRREMHMDRVPSCWPAIGLRRPVPSCRLPRTELQAVQYLLSLHHKICRHPFWTHYPCNMQARLTFVWVGK